MFRNTISVDPARLFDGGRRAHSLTCKEFDRRFTELIKFLNRTSSLVFNNAPPRWLLIDGRDKLSWSRVAELFRLSTR